MINQPPPDLFSIDCHTSDGWLVSSWHVVNEGTNNRTHINTGDYSEHTGHEHHVHHVWNIRIFQHKGYRNINEYPVPSEDGWVDQLID